MKSFLLLALFTILANVVGAQGLDQEMKKKFDDYLQKRNNDFALKEDGSIVVPYKGKKRETGKPPGVYTLPQDGMPYKVPDTKNIVAIPNAMSQLPDVALGKIPNAAAPRGFEALKGILNNLKTEPTR